MVYGLYRDLFIGPKSAAGIVIQSQVLATRITPNNMQVSGRQYIDEQDDAKGDEDCSDGRRHVPNWWTRTIQLQRCSRCDRLFVVGISVMSNS